MGCWPRSLSLSIYIYIFMYIYLSIYPVRGGGGRSTASPQTENISEIRSPVDSQHADRQCYSRGTWGPKDFWTRLHRFQLRARWLRSQTVDQKESTCGQDGNVPWHASHGRFAGRSVCGLASTNKGILTHHSDRNQSYRVILSNSADNTHNKFMYIDT